MGSDVCRKRKVDLEVVIFGVNDLKNSKLTIKTALEL